MSGKMAYTPLAVFLFAICATASILVPDSSVVRHCLGPGCPMYSLPTKVDKAGIYHNLNCTKGELVPLQAECQSFYFCEQNGTAIKLSCTFGYAFHPRLKMCVPETLVKSCGKVYCPPSILVGFVADPANCTRYYKCFYGVPMHFQCEPEYVYDEELGKCMEYGDDVPKCIKDENMSGGNTTTDAGIPATSTYLPTSSSSDVTTTTENSSVSPETVPRTTH